MNPTTVLGARRRSVGGAPQKTKPGVLSDSLQSCFRCGLAAGIVAGTCWCGSTDIQPYVLPGPGLGDCETLIEDWTSCRNRFGTLA